MFRIIIVLFIAPENGNKSHVSEKLFLNKKTGQRIMSKKSIIILT
jgi:hypothetical protein